MAPTRLAQFADRIVDGDGLSGPETCELLDESIRAGSARADAMRALAAAREAEEQQLGRDLTPEEAVQVCARDPLLLQAKAICDFNRRRADILGPLVTKQLDINAKRSTALALNAFRVVAQSEQKGHAALFAVSPMAWAIKKAWNGSPRRR
jgi:hypothetical protein